MKLSNTARRAIEIAVEEIFDRAKARLFGPDHRKRYALGGKRLTFTYQPDLTLTGLLDAVSQEHSVKVNQENFSGLLRVAEAYLDGVRERTKARTLHEVESFLKDATGDSGATPETVLGGKLTELWRDIHDDVKTIVGAETNNIKAFGTFEAIGKMAALKGVSDPYVYWVCVHDNSLCKECKRLHLMPDQITPRVWKMSEVGAGRHKKGDSNPKINGLHLNERCQMASLQPGYGFVNGRVTYVSPDHDELVKQRT